MDSLKDLFDDIPPIFHNNARTVIDFTEEICRVINKVGISRKDLASLLGIKKKKLNAMLDGSKNLTIQTIANICFHLGGTAKLTIEPKDKND